jgi:hypothetical protein
MKKYIYSGTLSLILSISFIDPCSAQDIRIFHSGRNESVLLTSKQDKNSSGWPDSLVKGVDGNSSFQIVVVNPNPFFYTYELKSEEFEIRDDLPSADDLIGIITSLINIPGSTPVGQQLARVIPAAPTTFEIYLAQLKSVKADIDSAKAAIERSDVPESREEALTGVRTSGFRRAVDVINALPAFKNYESLSTDLDKALDNSVSDGSFAINFAAADATSKELYKQAFKLLNVQLGSVVNDVEKVLESPAQLSFKVTVKQKGVTVRLVVKRKQAGKKSGREEFDRLVCVLIPRYERAALELIPIGHLTYTTHVPKYGLKDGVVTQSEDDGFRFKGGAMLLYNFLNFDKYNRGSLGIGIGYNIPQKGVLESFYLGSLVSYKNIFRVGAGVGLTEYPSGLKNGASVGAPLPPDVKDLNDVIDYRKRLSMFISFSFSGFPMSK